MTERPSGSLWIQLERPDEARALEQGLAGARRRLARPFCQELFSDYSDAEGRSLELKLAALQRTPASYVELVHFVDGAATGPCRRRQAMAATMPGSRVVWVCGRRVARQAQEDSRWVELVMIHELLHTLGLGENPPTSGAINTQVRWRCGGE